MIGSLEYILAAANVVAYGMIAIAILKRSAKLPENVTLEQAFRILENALNRSYPELHDGFTWGEITSKLKTSNARVKEQDWVEIENLVRKYEAFRYGGIDYRDTDPRAVLQLARKLPRGETIAG